MDRLQVPPIRTPIEEGNGQAATPRTAKEWYLYWQRAGELANDHTDTLAEIETALDALTEEVEGLDAVLGAASLTNPGAIPKVRTTGRLDESALLDDGTVVRLKRTISGTVQPTLEIDSGIAAKGRVGRVNNTARLDLSVNLSFDGTNFNLDDTTQAGMRISMTAGGIFFQDAPAGGAPAAIGTRATITTAGISVTGVYQVAGVQVVGPRGAALTASGSVVTGAPATYTPSYETSLATAINTLITRVNEIQARLQAHGLIA